MPRVSKRKKKSENGQIQVKYYRTYVYVRLSVKNGGHGREDTIYTQKQVCIDFADKHPELVVEKVYVDNGVTGTTFERPEFELLMEDVRAGKVDCILVKDFSRFGRDALEAVDLIDVVFPSLNVRFISVLDDYDSENTACTQDRVTHILTHFMNDYYAREVSDKLAQAHQISRKKGEFWGSRPPYGYERSEKSSKELIPEKTEKDIVRKIFYWFVFEDMSSYDIAKELNAVNVPSPSESYEMRKYGEIKKKKRRYWRSDGIRKILQNPVYIGCAVYGKTKQKLCENMPLLLIPKEQWEIKEDAWEGIVEKAIYEKAQQILAENWKDVLQVWATNPNKEHAANGPFLGRIYCASCGRKLARTNIGPAGNPYYRYYCPTVKIAKRKNCVVSISEETIQDAATAALRYQIGLAVDFRKKYGEEFYKKLEQEAMQQITKAREAYEKYEHKLSQLIEHYATGILDKAEYIELKTTYAAEQQKKYQKMLEVKKHYQELLDRLKAKIDWADALIKCRRFRTLNEGMVGRFIEKILVKSAKELTVIFWFRDIFAEEFSKYQEGGHQDVL